MYSPSNTFFPGDAISDYILLLEYPPQVAKTAFNPLAPMLNHYRLAIAHSEEQAAVHTAHCPPFLIILAGDYQTWSKSLLNRLRTYATIHRITLVALTDAAAASWLDQEDNPGFDGFLVNPLSRDILSSLVQSAHTRQSFAPIG
jgi:AmiR/NasT family two-component response regulator